MTKKMIFGLLLTLVGMAFSLFCFIQPRPILGIIMGSTGFGVASLGPVCCFPLSWQWL